MKTELIVVIGAALLLATQATRADFLPNNQWPNPAFEVGDGLEAPTGALAGWNRGGSDPSICQVTAENSISPTHTLIVDDSNPNGYGEWYADLSLAGKVSGGGLLNLQWYEMYSVDSGEMRVTVLFFNAGGTTVGTQHYVVQNQSPGWRGTVATSTFVKRNKSLAVPTGAVTVRISLVSGGPEATTGIMAIDDLSLTTPPKPQILAANFWPNASFEDGVSLDTVGGTPNGWTRGGTDATMCQVITNNYVSTAHALAVADSSTSNYGEWTADLPLAGHASPGDTLTLQWFELYSVTNGEMRLTAAFLNASGAVAGEKHFAATNQSAGWQGAVAGSGFTKRTEQLVVPATAVKLHLSLTSGTANAVTGIIVIDDLSIGAPPQPVLLTGNFWPNPTFETGLQLDLTSGAPSGWARNGSNTNVCQITTNNSTSFRHALAVIDGDESGYGQWDADFSLAGQAAPGDLLDIQWFELHSITNGEMRVTVLFFDADEQLLGQNHFTVTGQSAGWHGSIAASTFVLANHQVLVPRNAQRMRLSLASGGTDLTTGVLVLDDLSVARHPFPLTVLSYNLFPNPTFEEGAQLDNPALALPAGGWQRGGSDPSIDLVITNKSASPTHALALLDADESNYGEWYLLLDLSSLVKEGDVLDLQWFQLYNLTNGNMRLSFSFLDTSGNRLTGEDYGVSGQSTGWKDDLAASTFERQFQRLIVPAGTTQLRVNFASGGSAAATGLMVIDDLSMRLGQLLITQIATQPGGINLTWYSLADKTYTVSYADALSPTTVWSPLVTGLPSGGTTTTYLDTASHAAGRGFYRVVQE